MDNETMDLEQLASYLRRDLREVTRLANRGHLPGRKISGQWRFASAEIHHWLETQMPSYSEQELSTLEKVGVATQAHKLLVTGLLSEPTMAVPLESRTRASVLRDLVALAERSWFVYEPEKLLQAIQDREGLGSTALESGVALPHPRRPMPGMLGDSLIAYGRTTTGIPFGGPAGVLSDLFFLVCCKDQATHLRVLARLSRMLLRPGLVEQLRGADSGAETLQILENAENELIEG